MADHTIHRAHGLAWVYVCVHLAAHVIEEASTGFLDVWNPVLAGLRQRTGVPFPQLPYGEWLTILIVAVAGLLALTPLVFRGVAWLTTASYVLGVVMMANGVNHLVSPLYLGRFLPGQYTSPLLIVTSVWLILQAWRVNGTRDVRVGPVVGTVTFFVVEGGTVLGWVPYGLTGWRMGPPFFGGAIVPVSGGVLLLLGVAVLVECFARFALKGRGTPAPVAPPTTLVVSGLYRYTRNPMYVGAIAVIVGQALLLGSLVLLQYAAVVWLMVHSFVLVYEEPTLHRQFGSSYDEYRTHVPRWIPRLGPWGRPAGTRRDRS